MGKLFLFVVLHFILLVNQSNCLRCYACGEVNTFTGKNHTTIASCREFDESLTDLEALERFVIECPSGYGGCITQKQGGQVVRTCEIYALDDCQTANGVTYCYCNHDLCNGKLVQNHLLLQQDSSHQDLSDDEDYSEMSGYGEDDHLKEGSEDIGIRVNATMNDNETTSRSITSAINDTSSRISQASSFDRPMQFPIVLLFIFVILRF